MSLALCLAPACAVRGLENARLCWHFSAEGFFVAIVVVEVRFVKKTATTRSVAVLLKRSVVSAAESPTQMRCISSIGSPRRKVAVLGAAGGIGRPLGLLVKLNPLVTNLSLYDIAGTPGVAADISHVDTTATVSTIFLAQCLYISGLLSLL
jgi:hypothetical protein